MNRRIWTCDVSEGAGHDGLGPCTRAASLVVTWLDEAEEMTTMKVCHGCLDSVRHSLTWDTPTVVEVAVAPFAAKEVLA